MEDILQNAEEITSNYCLGDIETPFRIFAGPGAGKTHWLVEHIKDVIKKSDRLGPNQRVASISYTTAAANEVKERLGSAAVHVDVSTIHSFLYRNIVKPYLPWLRDDEGEPIVDFWNVDGHRPHRSNYGKVKKWIEHEKVSDWNSFRAFLASADTEPEDVIEFFESLYWDWDEEEDRWKIRFDWKGFLEEDNFFPYSTENLIRYKKLCWKNGNLDHSDVLYFAARLINEYPKLTRFLSARYPYVFVDEFQDTTPAQTRVLAALADAGTVTGVIGDIEQSIFSDFTGARPADFKHFQPAGQQTFYITSNRRSTQSILRVLNHIRQGSEQEHHKDDDDQQRDEVTPVILVASPKKAQRFLREQIDKRVQTLTRKNEMVRELAGAELPEKDYDGIWESLFEANQYRAEWLEATLEATRVALEEDQYGQGVRILYRGLRTKNGRVLKKVFSARGERKLSRIQRRRTAASLLPFLLSNHGEHHEMDGLEFYLDVRAKMEDFLPETPMVKPTRGSFKQLLESSSYEFLYTTTRLTSGKGKVKTIHKAKGEEYPVVLTYRGKREDDDQDATLSHLLDPSDTKTEERRVTYVAFSRAEDRLYICLEELSQQEEEDLNDLDIEIDIRRLHE